LIIDGEGLDIVRVRLATGWSETLMADIQQSVVGQAAENHLKIYRRAGLPGDMGIHIIRSLSSDVGVMGSLGLPLASELRELDMFEHSLWIEESGEGR
jgi:hypothetical protein